MLDGGEVSIDITCQFLTLQEVFIKHCEGDRVGGGVTLTDSCRIISVNIIDRNIGKSGEGVEDHTLLTVGQLDIIVRDSVSGVKSEFEPLLELRVKVGTEGDTVEAGTDNCSLLIHIRT